MHISRSINRIFGLCICQALIITCLVIFTSGSIFAKSFSVIIEKNDQPGFRTWESEDKNIAIDFPSDWQVAGKEGDKGVTLAKSRAGWFRLSLIDLPTGETLEKFSKHLIDLSVSKNWDIQFKKDKGTQTIGGKPCRVHQYRHKGNNRKYTGYNFINSTGETGVQILTHAANGPAKEEILAIVNTLRFSGDVPPALQLQLSDLSLPEDPEIIDQASPFPEIYTRFGPQKEDGDFKGHVFFKSNKSKSYPVYIAFYPVEKSRRKPKSRSDLIVSGDAQYTATNHKGDYTIDLDQGSYFAELYNADGKRWNVLKEMKLIKRSKAKKFHHFKIDNR